MMAKSSTGVVDQEALVEETKKELRSLLLSSKDGVLFKRLPSEYMTFVGRPFRCKDMGYRDLRDFVDDIPDVARQFVDSAGELRVAAVADQSTRRIQSLVSRQRSKKSLHRGRPFSDPRLFLSSRLPPRIVYSYARPRPTAWTGRMPTSQARRPVFGGSDDVDELWSSSSDLCLKKARVYVADSSNAYPRQSRALTSLASFPSEINVRKKAETAAAPSREKDLSLKPQVPAKPAANLVPDVQKRTFSQPKSSLETVTPQELTIKEMICRLLGKSTGITMFSVFKKAFFQEYGTKFEVVNYGFSDVTEMFSVLEIPAILKRLGRDDCTIIPSSKPVGEDKISTVRKRSSASVCSVAESEKSTHTQRSSHSVRDSLQCSKSLISNPSEVNTQSERSQGQVPLADCNSVKTSVVDFSSDELPKSISEDLKNALTLVLKSSPDGILISDLPAAIKERTGRAFKIEDTGYRSWDHLLLDLNDIVSMSYKGQGQLLLFDADRFTLGQNQYKFNPSFDHGSEQHVCYNSSSNLEASTFGQQQNIPEDSADPNLVIKTQTLPVGPYQTLTVYVSNATNPGNFWFQIDGEPYNALLSLMDSLQNLYSHPQGDQYMMPKSLMKCGRLCAAKFTEADCAWHRGTIKGFSGDMVEVYYLDYGTSGFVPKDDIRMLRSCCANLPAQAIRARLADVQPVGGEWSKESCDYFLTSISDRPFMPSISNISQDGLVSLSLYDTTGRDTVNLSSYLIIKGFATRQKDVYETDLQGRGYQPLSSLENISDSESQGSENDTERERLLSEMCSAPSREVTSGFNDINFVSKSKLLSTTNETQVFPRVNMLSPKKSRTNAVAPITQPEPAPLCGGALSTRPSIQPVPPGFVQPQYSFPVPVSHPVVTPSVVSPMDGLIRMFSHASIMDPVAQASSGSIPNLVDMSFRHSQLAALGLGYPFPNLQLGGPFPGYPAQLLQQYQMHQPYLANLQELSSLMAHRLPYGGHPPYNSSLLGLANLSYLAQANQPTVPGEALRVGSGAQAPSVPESGGDNPASSSTCNV